jgi:hypothetical protein
VTIDWPTAVTLVGALIALVAGLKVTLPYLVGVSSAETTRRALEDLNKRMAAAESHLGERRMPGRLR